jgi:hypothetical protein
VNASLARLLTRLYPRAWKARFGAEFGAFLESGRADLRTLANVICSALYERVVPTQGGEMDPHRRSFGAMMKQPTAFLPLAMSLTALAVVLGSVALFGVVHEADEGATAHI